MDISKARIGQRNAIKVIQERIQQGHGTTSIILPTGYGKSDVIRLVAYSLWETRQAACSLVISPNTLLRQQIISQRKLYESLIRYQIPVMDGRIKYAAIDNVIPNVTSSGLDYAANGEFLLSITIQLVQQNSDLFAEWIKEKIKHTGLPVLVFVDEVHTYTTMKAWGKTMQRLLDAGAVLVVLTATPFRDDQAPIIGFDMNIIENKPVIYSTVRKGTTPDKIVVRKWEGTRTYYTLKANYSHSFQDAWNENVLCHISLHKVEVDLSIIDPEGNDLPHRKLSELNEQETRRVLGRVVRNSQVIKWAVEKLVQLIRQLRAANPSYSSIAAVVFTANDESSADNDPVANAHAQEIKKAIRDIASDLKVVIATSADGSGAQVLEDFTERDQGDIAIVKQMAGLGMDAARIKIIVDLSPVRTDASFIQRVNRATRPFNGMLVAHLITLDDILSWECFNDFIESQGGAATDEVEMTGEYEKDKEVKDLPLFMVHEVQDSDIQDTKSNVAYRELIPLILETIETAPILVTVYTWPEIAAIAKKLRGNQPLPTDGKPVNTGDQRHDLRESVNYEATNVIKLRFARAARHTYRGGNKDDSELWGQLKAALWVQAYRRSGVPAGVELKDIMDVALLEKLASVMNDISDKEIGS